MAAPDLVIESDASNMGWGAVCNNCTTRGQWSVSETSLHINAKEMLAAFLALQTFARDHQVSHVRLRIDNATAVYYINHRGGTHSHTLMQLTLEMWSWCMQRKIFLSAEHLPGKLNLIADQKSRAMADSSEWKLNLNVFQQVMSSLGPCQIDFFCLKAYCSAPSVHELEARSGISGNGCSESKLGNKKMFCFSSFFPDREVSSKSEAGESSRISTDCTCMANTTVVPGADVDDTSTAITSAKHNNIADESEQRGSSSTTPGIVETSHMACIRSSLQSQGISQETAEIIIASWRHNTESAYSCNWRRWEVWCHENNYNPLGATISQI